jgi:hypothetical protein
MPKGTPETTCIGDYTNAMVVSDAACAIVLASYRAMALCK